MQKKILKESETTKIKNMIYSKLDHERISMSQFIDTIIKRAIDKHKNLDEYFITFHGKYVDHDNFHVSPLKISKRVPGMLSNTIVFWVSNKKEICEPIWTINGKKEISLNTKGVAYLQKKGAFPNMKETKNHGRI